MAGPWEKYQGVATAAGPWEKYGQRDQRSQLVQLLAEHREKTPEQQGPQGVAEIAGKVVPEALRALATGTVEGATAIPSLAGSAAEWLGKKAETPEMTAQREAFEAEQAGTLPRRLLQQGEELIAPQTKGGRVAANVIGSTVGAVTGGGGLRQAPGMAAKLAPMARVGAAGGVGAEAAGAVYDDNPLARLAGGLVGGGLYGLSESIVQNAMAAARGQGKRGEVAQSLMQGLTKEQVDEAAALQEQALAQHGVELSAGQVLPRSNIPAFELMATQFPKGAGLAEMFRRQPGQVQRATEAARGMVPGQAKPLPEIASQGQEAATKTIQGAKNWRSDLVKSDYDGQIPVDRGVEIQNFLANRLRETTQNTDDAELISAFKDNLMKQVGWEKNPVVSTQEIQKQMRQAIKNAAVVSLSGKQFSQEARNSLLRTIKDVKNMVGETRPEFLRAERNYARASEAVVNPLKEGTVGKMAGATGYIAGKPTTQQALIKALDDGTVSGSKSGILTTQRQLARFGGEEGKRAFNDTVKTWMANKLDNAIVYESGVLSPKVADNINAAFFKSESQRQGLRDALAGVADNTGMDREVLVKGMENYIRTMAAASKVPPKIGPDRAAINETINTMLGKLNAITAFTPVRVPARMANEYFKRDAIGHISKLLETPEGLKTLWIMAKNQPGSNKSFAAAAAFSAIAAQTNQAAQQQEK